MQKTQSNIDFERRARLVVIWEDLVNPVRAIEGYQEIVLEQAQRLGLSHLIPDLDKVLTAANTLGRFVELVARSGV